jgi:hypothetical protein
MHVDPPGIAIYIVEAGLAVAYWLLKKPKTPTLLILTQFLLYTDAQYTNLSPSPNPEASHKGVYRVCNRF